ncbi:MAG: glycosyltransferase [Prolixibacteraceae bacterium]|nr:glycosyltransferase [Prolixibacteraceae bacterium]
MKIAMLSSFYPLRGGIAQFNASLYQSLKKNNEVLPFTFKRQYPDFLFPGETQYVTVQDNAVPVDSIPILDTANPFGYGGAARRIAGTNPELLIMRYWMTYFAPSEGWVARKMKNEGCKVVTIMDNVIPHESKFFDKPFTRWFMKQNSGFVVMSESVQRDLLSLNPQAKFIYLRHPLYNHFGQKMNKAEACEKLGVEAGKKTLLFFGFIRDYKGLDLLIDAMDRLDKSFQLIIAGESYGSFEKYGKQIKNIHYPERIKVFNRYISDHEVPLFFSASDVCMLPYKSATQSGITSIAFHFDLPLIATNTGGLNEAIGKTGAGLMISEINADLLAAAIQKFFRQERAPFVENIQKEKSLLSWDNFAASICSFAKGL